MGESPRPWQIALTAVGVLGSIASILALEGWPRTAALCILVSCIVAAIAYSIGRGQKTMRDAGLDELGILRVFATATEGNKCFSSRLMSARKIRILAVNAEMLWRNMSETIKGALKNGATFELLMATQGSELVREMEEMEIADGRERDGDIDTAVGQSRSEFLALVRESRSEVAPRDHRKLGEVWIGHFNTQYRETMIICDEDWVWWTPHLNPARGARRPTFVAHGERSRLVELCVRHFEAVKKACGVERLLATGDARESKSRQPSRGLRFQGGYVTVGHRPELEPDDLTVEAWVYAIGPGGEVACIVRKCGPQLPGFVLRWKHKPGEELEFRLDRPRPDGAVIVSGPKSSLYLHRWVHVAGTCDSKTGMASLFINGEPTSSVAVQPMPYGADDLTIGGSPHSDEEAFDGIVRWVRVSDVVRYRTPFTPRRPRGSAGLVDAHTVLLLPLDEGEGTCVSDHLGQPVGQAMGDFGWVECP